jgi:type II secretory ATPase GspE/PulE/Tfp pilus assembly ATPase PilB-like protein
MSPTQANKKQEELEKALNKKIGEIAIGEKEDSSEVLAKELGLPFSNLTGTPIDPDAITILTEEESRAAKLAIIYKKEGSIIFAVEDPRLPETASVIERFQKDSNFDIKILVVSRKTLEKAWERYNAAKTSEVFEGGGIDIKEEELEQLQAQIQNISDLRNQLTNISVTKLLEILVAGALKTQASDIHFEPEQEKARLRYRLDGLLQDITKIEHSYYEKVLNRIKILSKLKINIHKTPQDGRFTIRQQSVDIEVRVSILPSEYGETIVMRLLDPRSIRSELKDLGMRPDILEVVTAQLERSSGAILTTGPTGSGKTTSLYAFVNHLNTPDMKIITVEDPIEYHIQGISQTQVDAEKSYTFANGLRAIVRQDPDVILIGEIRDLETADIAMHAALTGHLVFSTIHTNDAAGTIPRLIDLGIKPQTIAPAINAAMGQRLVRKLCEFCKKEDLIPTDIIEKVKKELDPIREKFNLPEITEKSTIHFPGKCDKCNNTGYKGRVGVYEIFTISKDMEKLIMTSPSISSIRDMAVAEGMTTMMQDGLMKLVQGVTSWEEVQRVLT